MLKNYFLTAIRHLKKNKGTSVINIAGLTLGISFAIVILLVVQYELSFDSYHTHAERIYRITRVSTVDGQTEYRTGVVYPLTDVLREGLTSVENIAAMQYEGGAQITLYDEEGNILNKFYDGFTFLESSFFKIFDFKGKDLKWLAGNPETALEEPYTLVLTESLAQKYFPGEDAMGKTLLLENEVNFKITGIITDLPENTDFPFKIMASYATLREFLGELTWYSVSDDNQAYVILKDGYTKEEVDAQIASLHAAQVDARTADFRKFVLQPLKEVHSDNRFGNFNYRTVSISTIVSLALVAFFLLLMACINFINLTTAQAVLRGKEVGIRKVLGGKRDQLVFQFLGETFIITTAAALLALFLSGFILIYFKDLLKVSVNHLIITDPIIMIFLFIVILFVTLLAGFYPALLQSGFNPVHALKSKLGNNFIKGVQLRRGLVSFQLIISQVFIISTIIVVKQMEYFRNADLGFDKEAVINVNLPQTNPEKLQNLKDHLESSSKIQTVSYSSSYPSGTGRSLSFQDIHTEDMAPGTEGIGFEHQSIDAEYLNIYKLKILAGRNFVPADSARSIIINQQLANRLGYSHPEDAIGQVLLSGGNRLTVVAVIENFNTHSLRDPMGHVGFTYNPSRFFCTSIKLSTPTDNSQFFNDFPEILAHIESGYEAVFPEYIFDYAFLDEKIDRFYAEETRLAELFKILAGLSIFIGCLGLYGLVTFMAVRRGKEIGIRKVLGASIASIMTLFSKDFILLTLFAFAVAAPISWYIMHLWLQNFVYRIDIGVEIFLLAGFTSLFIALATIGYQSIKSALTNPVESLGSE